jgi:hypothetical protein
LKQVRDKKSLFIERESDLVLSNIGFGSECGLRYSAKVVRATPWTGAQTVVMSNGWSAHC